MIINKKKSYQGFSLIEMLITITIIGVVMLISATTLTTLIKISTVSSNKTRVRNETEFVLELVRRTVRNSNPADVYIFNSSDVRKYNPETSAVENSSEIVNLEEVYSQNLAENESGNEIHFRPYGYESWICIGFFKSSADESKGYILKNNADDLWDKHSDCFSNNPSNIEYIMVLNSDSVNIKDFKIAYTISDETNYLIRFDINAEPVDWYLGTGAPVNKEVFRQTVVSTEGLIW
ncbi:MAG: type II secretion system protein J [Candidatus Dojkabacteria bacterium]